MYFLSLLIALYARDTNHLILFLSSSSSLSTHQYNSFRNYKATVTNIIEVGGNRGTNNMNLIS